MTIALQQAILVCVYKDVALEVVNLAELTPDLFPDTQRWYNPIMKYRRDGRPDDLNIAIEELGTETAPMLIKNVYDVSLVCYPDYLEKLKKYAFKKDLWDKLTSDSLNQEDLQKGLSIWNPQKKDTLMFNLTTDLNIFISELEKKNTGEIERYSWGLDFLDREIGKLWMGKLIVVKGQRKFGKTSFALRCFDSFIDQKLPSIFISTEMGYTEILSKIVSYYTKINSFRIREGQINPEEMKQITEMIEKKIYTNNSKIMLCTNLTMDYIKKRIDETKCKVLIVDYVQMLTIANIPYGMNYTQVLEEMAKYLKYLCLEKNITIIAVSQVNQDGDTKHCKAFEEKADTILWLHERKDGVETNQNKEITLDILNRTGNSSGMKLIYKKTIGDFTEDENKMLTADEKKTKWMQS